MAKRERLLEMDPTMSPIASDLGKTLRTQPSFDEATEIKTPYGEIKRLGRKRNNSGIPERYRYKKYTFSGDYQGLPVIITHYLGEQYGEDDTFFRRNYANSKAVYSGELTAFTERKIVPRLLSFDDETMTLVTERNVRDLSSYFDSTDSQEISRIIDGFIDLVKTVYVSSASDRQEFPRYTAAFIEPEYPFLSSKKPEDYLKDPISITYYHQTQEALRGLMTKLKASGYHSGFGFGDVKPGNLVEDDDGQVLFIDVGKPGWGDHWADQLGQFYQSTLKNAPGTLFCRVLKTKIIEELKNSDDPFAVPLFSIGRINRLVLPYTLRNIVATAKLGGTTDEKAMRDTLAKVRYMTTITDPDAAVFYTSDVYDSHWRQRLTDYEQTAEFKDNLEKLSAKLDANLPGKKPDKKLVILFTAMAGSGKSTLAKIIGEKVYPSVVLASDWIFFTELRDQIEDDYYKAYAYQEALARKYLKSSYSVVFDDNNPTALNRFEVAKLATGLGAQPIVVLIDIDVKTAAGRQTLKGGETISMADKIKGLKFSSSLIEPLTKEEQSRLKVIRVNGKLPLKEIQLQLEQSFAEI
jgi:predicted kinase